MSNFLSDISDEAWEYDLFAVREVARAMQVFVEQWKKERPGLRDDKVVDIVIHGEPVKGVLSEFIIETEPDPKLGRLIGVRDYVSPVIFGK